MEINIKPKGNGLFNAYYLFFLTISMQVGIGVTTFSRDIIGIAGHDGWISVIIAAIVNHITALIIVKTLEDYPSADLYGIHYDAYGKWIGNALSIIFIFYYVTAVFLIFRGYIEIITAWLFPELPIWLFNIMGLTIIVYGITGGIRVLVGLTVFVFFGTSWMALLGYFPLQYAEWHSLLPVYNTSFKNILMGAYQMTFSITGFEIIYFLYPYVKEKSKVNKYTQLGILYSDILYLLIVIISIVYFSNGQIEKIIWPVLTYFKIVRFPFIERFEIIAISVWMLLVIPSSMLSLWAATKGFKRMFNFSQKKALYILIVIIFISSLMISTSYQLNTVFKYFSILSFYLVFVYPFILFTLVKLKKKWRQSNGGKFKNEKT